MAIAPVVFELLKQKICMYLAAFGAFRSTQFCPSVNPCFVMPSKVLVLSVHRLNI